VALAFPEDISTGGHAVAQGSFGKGDKVEWKSHGQNIRGKVAEKITGDTHAAGRQVRASDNDPQYRVTSDKTGADAVHKPDALRPEKH
jgi:Hypervirulence associated proteins TUDOR domain